MYLSFFSSFLYNALYKMANNVSVPKLIHLWIICNIWSWSLKHWSPLFNPLSLFSDYIFFDFHSWFFYRFQHFYTFWGLLSDFLQLCSCIYSLFWGLFAPLLFILYYFQNLSAPLAFICSLSWLSLCIYCQESNKTLQLESKVIHNS